MAAAVDRVQLLSIPPPSAAAAQGLLPELRTWFARAQGEPTAVQRHAWPAILQGRHLLLASPTGSGKTLAAFVPIFHQLLADPRPGLQCLYIAPLKALNRDVRRNLRHCWRGMRQMGFFPGRELRIGLRTGDTSQRVRRRQIADPPAILLTTPESLAQMLAHPTTHDLLRSLRWVIVDEIHALAGNKRGADLALSLERLAAAQRDGRAPQRIGLSATCAPLATVAQFLVGADRTCSVAQVSDRTEKQLVIEPLYDQPTYSPSWMARLLERLDTELAAQQTTLIFTNTRHLAERLTWALRRRYPEREAEIAVHHASLSAARRRVVERRLKHGRLWAVVSSASLELGIDIGTVDSVVFVHPPGGVARFLQRVGRSGHRPEQPKRGVLLTATPGELLESLVTAASGRDGQIEPVRVLEQPLDVLCQQLAGMAMSGVWSIDAAFELVRRAAPFRQLSREDFQACLDYLSGLGSDGKPWLRPRLCWEGDCFSIADERTARLLRRNLGTILTEESCTINLRAAGAEDEVPRALGAIDQVYAERLRPGDRFVLDGRCLEMKERGSSALLVEEVFGRPLVPRWLGAGVPMPAELARRLYLFRVQAAEALRDGDEALRAFLGRDFPLQDAAVASLRDYLLGQETVSEIPTLTSLLIETVAMQSCQEYFVHTPLPRGANEALARVLLQRWQAAGETQVLATPANLGIYVLATGANPLAAAAWRGHLSAANFAEDFQAQLAASDLLAEHFTRVAQTGLLVLRQPARQKRRLWLARRLYEQLRAAAPDFVLLRQAEQEVRNHRCDLPAALAFAASMSAMTIRVRSLAGPSPFGESLLRQAAGNS